MGSNTRYGCVFHLAGALWLTQQLALLCFDNDVRTKPTRAGTETRPYTDRLPLSAPDERPAQITSCKPPSVNPPSQLLTLPHPIGLFQHRNDLVEAGPFGGAVDAVLAA